MPTQKESGDLGDNRVCWTCVGDAFLRSKIKKSGKTAACDYCGKRRRSFALGEIGDLTMEAIEDHYAVASESSGDDLDHVVAEEAEIDAPLARDLVAWMRDQTYDFEAAKIGEPQRFDKENYYRAKESMGWELQVAWEEFEAGFKHSSRFFSRAAIAMFERIFTQLSDLRAAEGAPVIVEAGPQKSISTLYRGRVFFSEEATHEALKYPHRHMGPPPDGMAIAGRMNPQGISVFYGATSLETVLSETRPPVGANVVVAKFELVRPLLLLNVSAFRKVLTQGSMFDPAFLDRQNRGAFLNRLARRISRPIMPGDEPLDYLATQAMAEYFAELHEPRLDGLIYGSAQAGSQAQNVVLFHRASKVEDVATLAGTTFEISRDYGHPEDHDPSTTYIVMETAPKAEQAKVAEDQYVLSAVFGAPEPLTDGRPVTLKLDVDSLTVCSMEPSEPSFVDHDVKRYRMQESTPRAPVKFAPTDF